ncbi:hypothetical protein LEP1GSC047_3725 [Leptospira inadai serovar Lyme str. 10]|uniref:Uncharacterized protein n=1 Tax=Leptospira inadai serovar Lyme str. 10 TaxID=1049790 RepID=V6HCW3_9LEPT|nr:hypothetical protein LEP1GSC047_3725 [Leptospira inadai serovar Lyme str. 10]
MKVRFTLLGRDCQAVPAFGMDPSFPNECSLCCSDIMALIQNKESQIL